MHELHLTAADKAARYAQILPQLRAIIEDESDTVANLANTAAVLKEAFGWLWIGFYRVVARLYPHRARPRCLRAGVGAEPHAHRAGRQCPPRPHRLLLALAIGNRRAAA